MTCIPTIINERDFVKQYVGDFHYTPSYFVHLNFVEQSLEGTFWRTEKMNHNHYTAEQIITKGIPERWA